ncbi:MAG: RNA methyltransferase, partial [Muribaculaceae bacterium]|nr:RNA methyltransferase [Muribaculaceae bacterium]
GNRMVSFEGDLELMYKANMCCRTALRILKPIVRFIANDPDELYDAVRDLDWSEFMGPDSTFAIDSTVNSAEFTHSRFVTYRVKDGIVDHFNDKLGRRPSIRVSGADVLLNVHISDNRVTISLDSSGEPLSKRGYRIEQTEAPINEVLAAGIIMKTGWRGESDFVDPMCGSGTFLIEAALIAANINPGVYREHFAFEKWPDFDKELFEEIYNDDSEEREFAYKIYGGDIDPEAVTIARKNIRNARVDDMVELVCQPFADWTDNAAEGILVTNPPYGERLRPDDMTGLFKSIGTTLKNYFKGWHAWILGYRDEHFADIGLKPTVKIPLLNGSLECSLREYVLFDGSYSAFRSEGGSIGNKDKDNGPRKVRHISDDEWEKESKAFNKAHGKGITPKREQRKDNKRPDKRSGYNDKRALPTSGSKGRYDDFDDFEQDITPRPSYPKRDGERGGYQKRDGERPSYPKRDGERGSYQKRD